jgi:hypothetical protein
MKYKYKKVLFCSLNNWNVIDDKRQVDWTEKI